MSTISEVLRDFKGDYSSLFTPQGGWLKYDEKKKGWLITQIRVSKEQQKSYFKDLVGVLVNEPGNHQIEKPENLAKRINDMFHVHINCHFKPNDKDFSIVFNSKDKEYSFLSNFHFTLLVLDGKFYASSENAYQDLQYNRDRKPDSNTDANLSPRSAKKQNKRLRRALELNGPLDEDAKNNKIRLMERVIQEKFRSNDTLRNALVATAPYDLKEKTDTDFWGVGRNGEGENNLGKILMKLRKSLIQDRSEEKS